VKALGDREYLELVMAEALRRAYRLGASHSEKGVAARADNETDAAVVDIQFFINTQIGGII